jgi:hypothetical protein
MNTRTFREMNMEGRKERPERREPSLEAKGEARQNQTSAEPSPGMSEQTSDGVVDTVWAQIFARENLNRAVKRVEANQGAPGVDGMTVAELRPYLQAHWLELKASLEAESYRPAAVKRVAIPKAGGGERLLGIPMRRSHCTSIQGSWVFFGRRAEYALYSVYHVLSMRDMRFHESF